MQKELWKGNEAIAEAAIRAGCRAYFGYPITPQNEIPEYMSKRMPESGGVFVQAESELAAINMVYGAAAAGARAMTSSSSPGISLMQEGISYLVGSDLPAVIVNMMRGGPGLGTIQPGQADYYQATRSPGHGDGHMPVLAPSGIQEAVDLMWDAFEMADKYLTPVMVVADGMIGQMMEPIVWNRTEPLPEADKPWAANGRDGEGQTHFVSSLRLQSSENEQFVHTLKEKYEQITKNEVRYEAVGCKNADILIAAFGTTARIASTAIRKLEKEGIKAGLFRLITLWPFPYEALKELALQESVKAVLTVEMSLGQMHEDVRLSVLDKKPTPFYGRTGGMVPEPKDIAEKVRDVIKEAGK